MPIRIERFCRSAKLVLIWFDRGDPQRDASLCTNAFAGAIAAQGALWRAMLFHQHVARSDHEGEGCAWLPWLQEVPDVDDNHQQQNRGTENRQHALPRCPKLGTRSPVESVQRWARTRLYVLKGGRTVPDRPAFPPRSSRNTGVCRRLSPTRRQLRALDEWQKVSQISQISCNKWCIRISQMVGPSRHDTLGDHGPDMGADRVLPMDQ
jgi:hypothetical protein